MVRMINDNLLKPIGGDSCCICRGTFGGREHEKHYPDRIPPLEGRLELEDKLFKKIPLPKFKVKKIKNFIKNKKIYVTKTTNKNKKFKGKHKFVLIDKAKLYSEILENREKLIKAFIAETGCLPSEVVQMEKNNCDGIVMYWLEKKGK